MRIAARHEQWPIAGTFAIARGAKTHADVVVAELEDAGVVGRGECVPYRRYGETIEGVIAAIEAAPIGRDRASIPPSIRGAARSALDLALWELEARRAGRDVAELAGLSRPDRIASAITISIDAPDVVRERARGLADRPLLKIKLAGDALDLERVRAIREAAPRATLWVDANEGWDERTYEALAPRLAELGAAMLEQPLPEGRDGPLRGARPLPVCADESAHGAPSIAALADRYDAVNVKLDKAGGLTGAIETIAAARAARLSVVLGCMVSTSLAIAPACLLAGHADLVDLDGSVLLARDREGGARMERGLLVPPAGAVWGSGS